jgi:hypothetical protein
VPVAVQQSQPAAGAPAVPGQAAAPAGGGLAVANPPITAFQVPSATQVVQIPVDNTSNSLNWALSQLSQKGQQPFVQALQSLMKQYGNPQTTSS